ncbi:hypothetical protein ACPYO6_12605 [Georgenia sp. Z1344]|uniref:hypothetical protein n=1 Tax=Georgenia sp. Z1344 TaxID=3416706 RepID=UPI003CE8DCB7
MSPTTRLRRSAPALLLVAALAGACAGGDPVGTVPPDGPTTGPDGPAQSYPDTDDVLDLGPTALDTIDALLLETEETVPSLTPDELRAIEEQVLDHTGHDTHLGINPDDTGSHDAFDAWTVSDDEMGLTAIVDGRVDPADAETYPLTEEEAGGTEALDVVQGWRVQASEAAVTALAIHPGEVLVVMPPEEPASVVLVGIRADDGSVVRVGIDAVTGEVLNVVTPEHDPGQVHPDGPVDGEQDKGAVPAPHAPDDTSDAPTA